LRFTPQVWQSPRQSGLHTGMISTASTKFSRTASVKSTVWFKLMTEASAAMQFERAAALRDRLGEMEWLWEKLNWLRQARRENTFVYPLAGLILAHLA